MSAATPHPVHRRRWTPQRRLLRSRLPRELRDWLLDPASLTHRVRQACPGRFGVRVLAQGWGRPSPDECRVLGLRNGTRALIRQVQLTCDGRPWVYARTVIPATSLGGALRRLAHLGERSLGSLLFAAPGLRRGPVELLAARPGMDLFARAVAGLAGAPAAVWGRRSVFRVAGRPLLVAEFFLPAVGRRRSGRPGSRAPGAPPR